MSIVILTATLHRANGRVFGNLDRGGAAGTGPNPRLIDYLKVCAWCPSEVALAQQHHLNHHCQHAINKIKEESPMDATHTSKVTYGVPNAPRGTHGPA